MFKRLMRRLRGRVQKTNEFTIQLPAGGKLGGHLTSTGDLYLQVSESGMYRIPGHLIAPLAHWLSGVDGKFSYVHATEQTPKGVVLQFPKKKQPDNKGAQDYADWLTED